MLEVLHLRAWGRSAGTPGRGEGDGTGRDRKHFEKTLADFQLKLSALEARQIRRLGICALIVALLLACVQIWTSAMSMPADAIGISFGHRVLAYTQTVASWFNRTF